MTAPVALSLSSDAMRDVVAAAILQHITATERDALIQAALTHLLKPGESRGYGSQPQPSPLAEAFNRAASIIAHQEASKLLAADETFTTKMRELIVEATTQVFKTRRGATVTKIADAITRAFEPDR